MTPSRWTPPPSRRKHEHFRVTITYTDNKQSAKVFIDRTRAEKFAARQKKSPVVKAAEVVKLD